MVSADADLATTRVATPSANSSTVLLAPCSMRSEPTAFPPANPTRFTSTERVSADTDIIKPTPTENASLIALPAKSMSTDSANAHVDSFVLPWECAVLSNQDPANVLLALFTSSASADPQHSAKLMSIGAVVGAHVSTATIMLMVNVFQSSLH